MGRLPHRLQELRRVRRSPVAIRFRANSYPVNVALELERDVGLDRPVAVALARRGIGSVSEAEAFLDEDAPLSPPAFAGMPDAGSSVLDAIRSGRRVTIYGDFDCDGVCATSILVNCIRDLGGQCDWFIPDRITEGYGLNAEAIESIAARGTELVITVDCGVTAVSEVALARQLGMDVLVTDHHQPDAELPDCQILHPEVCGYPFPWLCGAAVAARLAAAIREQAGGGLDGNEADLDLVALATVADVMPLIGENRQLVREGLRVARRAQRLGMAALMKEARIEPQSLRSEDLGFRLAPRINAAGRIYRADAGVELFLADSQDRAVEIAVELSKANLERRRIEREVASAATAMLKDQADQGAAVVVSGDGWHSGVVGIVASKLVKETGRPAVVIAVDGELGRGSARSVPGLDLRDAIGESAELLEGFGGHAAAAGLTIKADRIEEFRVALSESVERRIGSELFEPAVSFDAVAGGSELSLETAEQIERLEPFGKENPAIRLLIPGAKVEDEQAMGEGKHCRFSVCSGGFRAKGVAFGRNSLGVEPGQRADLVAELGINHWNGSIESRLQVIEVVPVGIGEPLAECEADEWWARFEKAMVREFRSDSGIEIGALTLEQGPSGQPGVVLSELISSGERIAVLTADARQRWLALGGEAMGRFIADDVSKPPTVGSVIGLWAGSPERESSKVTESDLLLTDYESLEGPVEENLGSFDRIVLLDPPYTAESVSKIGQSNGPVNLLAGPDEFEFSSRVAGHRLDLTGQLRELYRSLRDADSGGQQGVTGEELRKVLSTDGTGTRSPEQAAALLRVLDEAGLARIDGSGAARRVGVVSSKQADLTVSAVFVHHFELHKEQERFLSQFNRQNQKP